MIAKAAPWKHGTISKLSEDISRGGTLAIIDIHGIPADAMLGMRKTLRESMSIRGLIMELLLLCMLLLMAVSYKYSRSTETSLTI